MLDSAGHLCDAPRVTVTPVGPTLPSEGWGAPREEVAGGRLWTAGRSEQLGSSSVQRLVEAGPREWPGLRAQASQQAGTSWGGKGGGQRPS